VHPLWRAALRGSPRARRLSGGWRCRPRVLPRESCPSLDKAVDQGTGPSLAPSLGDPCRALVQAPRPLHSSPRLRCTDAALSVPGRVEGATLGTSRTSRTSGTHVELFCKRRAPYTARRG
jgi:hypothetical protein